MSEFTKVEKCAVCKQVKLTDKYTYYHTEDHKNCLLINDEGYWICRDCSELDQDE